MEDSKKKLSDAEAEDVSGGSFLDLGERLVFQTYGIASAPQACVCARCNGAIEANESCWQSSASGSYIHNACREAWRQKLYS